jgi:hypothetical protein
LEVEVRVPLLGIHLDSLHVQFRVRLDKSEVAGVKREAIGKVDRWLGIGEGGTERRRRGSEAEGKNQLDSRGGK